MRRTWSQVTVNNSWCKSWLRVCWKRTFFAHRSLIVKSQHNWIALVIRPAIKKQLQVGQILTPRRLAGQITMEPICQVKFIMWVHLCVHFFLSTLLDLLLLHILLIIFRCPREQLTCIHPTTFLISSNTHHRHPPSFIDISNMEELPISLKSNSEL